MERLSYVLPIRTTTAAPDPDLTAYLRDLARDVDLVVVDGSADDVFACHHAAWAPLGRHVPPDERTLNGKVGGVATGLRLARHEKVVVADDDVRWTTGALREVARALDGADVVVPQNHYSPCPPHALYDTARTLVHRALGGDMPGTLALRRGALGPGGYRADVLFENLELLRTVAARGGRVRWRRDLVVARRPPGARHLAGQRVRQAYDEFARPYLLAAELALLPVLVATARRHPPVVPALAVVAAAVAEVGRRRDGGQRYFSPAASALAPLWVAERAVCAWLAVGYRLTGGVPYRGRRLRTAASSPRSLRTVCAATPGGMGTARRRGESNDGLSHRHRHPRRRP
ncbi:MAG TPA: glycosyltransferase family 2 protein [Mycobacteriales bacterium]|nr:glycosyltransferase family 2 protein [Mycobacteriales bacterium]